MTAATIERKTSEDFGWRAHAHIDEFAAGDERDAAFALWPELARKAEALGVYERGDKGGLFVPESKLHVAKLLQLPHVSGELLRALGAQSIGERDWEGNLLLNGGINNRLLQRLIGGTNQGYDSTHTALGAGDTNTAASASQTDLQAAVNASNRYIQIVDSAPTGTSQILTCVATFATGNGNFAWAEWIIAQNTASGANAATAEALNRKVASLGTKTSAAAWAFTVTITFS